jgi:hypothetical protein
MRFGLSEKDAREKGASIKMIKKISQNIYFQGIIVFFAFLATMHFLGPYSKYLRENQQTIVFTLTALIVFFYTYETHKMRREMVNQTKILSSPFISIFIRTDEDNFDKFWVRNSGEVTGRSIELETLESLNFGLKVREEEVSFVSFKSIDTLAQGAEEELKVELKCSTVVPKKNLTLVFLSDLRKRSQSKEFHFKLRFRNIFDESYSADVIFKNAEFLVRNFIKN